MHVEQTGVSRQMKKRSVRGTLSRDLILEAAVRLVDAQGIKALSTRVLGRELGVEGMALYWYVRNKDDLLEGLIDKIWEETDPDQPPASGDWAEHMRVVMESIRRAGLAHPHIFALLADHHTAKLQALGEADIAVLRRAGFSEELAQYAVHTLFGHVYWHVMGEVWGYYAERRAAGGVKPRRKRLFKPGLEIIIAGVQTLLNKRLEPVSGPSDSERVSPAVAIRPVKRAKARLASSAPRL
jgi:AcrR family transcriptional regulator